MMPRPILVTTVSALMLTPRTATMTVVGLTDHPDPFKRGDRLALRGTDWDELHTVVVEMCGPSLPLPRENQTDDAAWLVTLLVQAHLTEPVTPAPPPFRRAKTEAPTEDGVYYARHRGRGDGLMVVEVSNGNAYGTAWAEHFAGDPVKDYDLEWFGPVLMPEIDA